MREAVIVSTARTPIGKAFRGAFNNTEAPAMSAIPHTRQATRFQQPRSRQSHRHQALPSQPAPEADRFPFRCPARCDVKDRQQGVPLSRGVAERRNASAQDKLLGRPLPNAHAPTPTRPNQGIPPLSPAQLIATPHAPVVPPVPAPEAFRLSFHFLPRCDVGRSNKDALVAAAQHRKRNTRAHGILSSTLPGLLRKLPLSSKMPSPFPRHPPSCHALAL